MCLEPTCRGGVDDRADEQQRQLDERRVKAVEGAPAFRPHHQTDGGGEEPGGAGDSGAKEHRPEPDEAGGDRRDCASA